MSNQEGTTTQTVVGLVAFVIAILFFVFIFWILIVVLGDQPAVIVSIITVVVTAGGGYFTMYQAKKQDRKAAVEAQLREKKVIVYEGIADMLYSAMNRTIRKEEIDEEEIRDKMLTVMEQLTIWGPDKVVNIFVEFKRSGIEDSSIGDPRITLKLFADLMLAIRKDIGHKDEDINWKTILRIFVTDIDEYYK